VIGLFISIAHSSKVSVNFGEPKIVGIIISSLLLAYIVFEVGKWFINWLFIEPFRKDKR
jgi:Kef-type K+ transport system membrane component KefB